MPLRNPFARQPRPSSVLLNDENARPPSSSSPLEAKHPGFERVDTVGSKRSTSTAALSIRSSHSTEEYKMSVVNDSGVYLPPSPVEKEAPTWPKRYLSRQSSEVKREGAATATGEIEHFSISRESFDSYRRSFDISARSPIPSMDALPRQSLDSHTRFYSSTSSSTKSRLRPLAEKKVPEDREAAFEDVGLNDENRQPTPAPVKKRGFFSKFGSEEQSSQQQQTGEQPPQHQGITSRLMGHGRKRGQSLTSTGAELAPMPMERAKVEEEVQG